MSAASFVLAINLFVAGLFGTAFGVVAAYYRSAIGARWLAAAYAVGIANGLMEFFLPYQVDGRPLAFAIFAAFLTSVTLCNIGLARHYQVRVPLAALGIAFVGSLAVNLFILDMPRESFLRAMLYQAPYALMNLIGVSIILSRPRNRSLDLALLALFVLSALSFLSKPFIAMSIGSGESAQAYLGSNYAAISQASGAILLISNGLLMLLIMVRDMMADVTLRSETDPLSGLLNRRGFEDQADKARLLALRAGVPAVMIVSDLDHFKLINDSYGHDAGDAVIAAFGRALKRSFDTNAVIGRLGGEEFAAMLPGMSMVAALYAIEKLRERMRDMKADERGIERVVTGSFGLARLEPADSLADLLRRADRALYEAKAQGRDRIAVSPLKADGADPAGPHAQSGPDLI